MSHNVTLRNPAIHRVSVLSFICLPLRSRPMAFDSGVLLPWLTTAPAAYYPHSLPQALLPCTTSP